MMRMTPKSIFVKASISRTKYFAAGTHSRNGETEQDGDEQYLEYVALDEGVKDCGGNDSEQERHDTRCLSRALRNSRPIARPAWPD